MNINIIAEVQKWYASNCDGEWEEDYGIKIETMDNPGWSVSIDLYDTNLEDKKFDEINKHDSEKLWIDCRVEDNIFKGFCDPSKLKEILTIFINWAKSQNEDWLRPPPPLSEEAQKRLENDNFWKALGEEIGPELCKHPRCTNKRIRYSVMCRDHHFEMVTGQSRI